MSKTIEHLRATLFETLEAVKNGTMDLDRARAVNDVAKTIVDSAKVEVDYVRATDAASSTFLSGAAAAPALPNGITGVVRHRLEG